jgi:hypothetical protein
MDLVHSFKFLYVLSWIWDLMQGMDLKDLFIWISLCTWLAFLCTPVEDLGLKGEC